MLILNLVQCRNSNGIYTIPCRPQRVEGNENMGNYTAHWKLNRTADIVNNLGLLASSQVSESVQEAFLYQSERLTGAGSFWGAIQSYPGGGYVAQLGNVFLHRIYYITIIYTYTGKHVLPD